MAVLTGGDRVIPGSKSRVITANLGSPEVGATDDVHDAIVDDGSEQTITTGITNPPTARTITATAGGTTADIKAIQVTIHGLDEFGEIISEVLPVFTVNTAGSVVGVKAFASITSIVVPAHDDTEATTKIGLGETLGLPARLSRMSVVNAFFGGVLEGTFPTVLFNADNIENNTILLDTTLDGSAVLVDYYQSA